MPLLIPGSTTASTPLGYGSSQLMGGITRRQSVALLEAAFEAGIRHFDTAPSYGYGRAERVLGETLRARRHEITITTKFGLLAPRNRNLLRMARRIALPVVRRLPGIKARLSRAAGGFVGRAAFAPDALLASIDASLAALGTDYIDLLLLHEATLEDLSDDLFEALERSVEAGKIRAFGTGSEAGASAQMHRFEPRFCRIMQFEWSVLSGAKPAYEGSFQITHRSLLYLAKLRAWLEANPQAARRWSQELGRDLASGPVLSRLMLAAARHANPGGITLFSSRSVGNIRANAGLLQDDAELRLGGALAALVRRDAAALLGAAQPAPASFPRGGRATHP